MTDTCDARVQYLLLCNFSVPKIVHKTFSLLFFWEATFPWILMLLLLEYQGSVIFNT